MARSFVTTDIIDPVKAPFSKRSLDHLNSAIEEIYNQLVEGTFVEAYTTNDVIVLSGCLVISAPTSSVTAGKIYYNGKIYNVDANASISRPSDTLVWTIETTYITGDPATFSDGNSYNFHKIEKFKLINAVSGSGIADYNGANLKYKIKTIKLEIDTWNMSGVSSKTVSYTSLTAPGLRVERIISAKAVVISDDVLEYGHSLTMGNVVDGTTGLNIEINSSNVTLYRIGTKFTGSNWDGTSANRGYVYITYGDI